MKERLEAIQRAHPEISARESSDWPAFDCPQANLLDFLGYLKREQEFDFLTDVTAIDHFDAVPRYEVVYHLYSTERHEYLRVASPCGGNTDPVCASVVSLWPTADWHERETYDMFGIEFKGHPDLRRILMWDGYPYHPLRKEFPLAGEEVEFPDADLAEATGTGVKPAPMMGGPFHSPQVGTMSRREPRADDESWTEVRVKDDIEASDSDTLRDFKPSD